MSKTPARVRRWMALFVRAAWLQRRENHVPNQDLELAPLWSMELEADEPTGWHVLNVPVDGQLTISFDRNPSTNTSNDKVVKIVWLKYS